MSEMIELVARAIALADEQNGGAPWDYLMSQGKRVTGPIYDRARAAIEAMREPTADMIDAWENYLEIHRSPEKETDTSVKAVWRTMIDAALSDK